MFSCCQCLLNIIIISVTLLFHIVYLPFVLIVIPIDYNGEINDNYKGMAL